MSAKKKRTKPTPKEPEAIEDNGPNEVSNEQKEELTDQTEPINEKPKELTAIEKVQIMHALTSAVSDPEVQKILKNRDMGDVIYGMFVEAVEKKVSKMMTGNEEDEVAIARMDMAANSLVKAADDLHGLITSLMRTQLVNVLTMMNQKLAGTAGSNHDALAEEEQNNPQLREQRIREMREQHQRELKNGAAPSRRGRGDGVPGL